MVVGSRALGYMALWRLKERERAGCLRGQPSGRGRRGAGCGGGWIAHHQPSHAHVRAVRRKAEGQETQQRPNVHVGGAGQLG